jgi:hypothetical protein
MFFSACLSATLGVTPACLAWQKYTYSYINSSGASVGPPKLTKASDFSNEGFALVTTIEKTGDSNLRTRVMRTDGSFCPIANELEPQAVPSDGWILCKRLAASSAEQPLKSNGGTNRFTFVNASGARFPLEFDVAGVFSHGLAPIMLNGRFGLVKSNGSLKLESKAVGITEFGQFAEGFVAAAQGQRWGYLNSAGKWVVKPEYKSASPMHSRWGQVEVFSTSKSQNVFTLVDATGKTCGKTFSKLEPFEDGVAAAAIHKELGQGRGVDIWGLLGANGKWILEPRYSLIGRLSSGLRVFQDGKKFGYLSNNGELILQPKYSLAGPFSAGLAWVVPTSNSELSFIDKLGHPVISMRRGRIDFRYLPIEFSSGLCPIPERFGAIYPKWGYIDRTGEWRILPKFDKAFPFHNGFARVGSRNHVNCSFGLRITD